MGAPNQWLIADCRIGYAVVVGIFTQFDFFGFRKRIFLHYVTPVRSVLYKFPCECYSCKTIVARGISSEILGT